MTNDSYLRWLADETPTRWWHDSAEPHEIEIGLAHGAVGITTNPILSATTLSANREFWGATIRALPDDITPREKSQLLIQTVVQNAASMFQHIYDRTNGEHGYVCAQVDPSLAADRESMYDMAKRFSSWAPNIAVKLPATAAGLDVLEDCAAAGITVTATVSFTVPQVIAVAERYRKGLRRAREAGISPGRCFAVIMIGRLDDYLQDVAKDRKANVTDSDIKLAGLAVSKRAYSLYRERGYEAELLVAAMRGSYHVTGLAGADLTLSIHPTYQAELFREEMVRDPSGIDKPVPPDAVKRLETLPDFVRAYNPDGMNPEEFLTYGLTQRTLAQFQASWSQIESLRKDG